MKGNSVHGGRHAMFAYTIVDIGAAVIVTVKNTVIANFCVIRTGQVSRTTKQGWAGWYNCFKCFLASYAGGQILRVCR